MSKFKDLKVGDTFEVGYTQYVKIKRRVSNGRPYNCMAKETRRLRFCGDSTEVRQPDIVERSFDLKVKK